ncbi:hypothetical protein P3L10_009087 [Capsicum annuum]
MKWNKSGMSIMTDGSVHPHYMINQEDYNQWYFYHSHLIIENSKHIAQVEYQPTADRHEALARRHIRSYQISQSFVNDNNQSEEVKQITAQFASIFLESMTVASLGTRLTFDSEYTPPNEYEQPPLI